MSYRFADSLRVGSGRSTRHPENTEFRASRETGVTSDSGNTEIRVVPGESGNPEILVTPGNRSAG